MKKFKLVDLHVQSFVTIKEDEVMKTAKGGTDETFLLTRPRRICLGESIPVVACITNQGCTQPPQCHTTC